MYNSYKDSEKVNSIPNVNVVYMKDEITRGHVLSKGDLNQANVDEGYEDLRGAIYREETDALYFKYVRGETTQQEWLDAVESVKLNYPTPII